MDKITHDKRIDLSVIIPVFNEKDSIIKMVSKLKEALSKSSAKGYEIIVVDDGSTDGSGKIIDEIEGIRAFRSLKNRGYGASIKKGIKLAKYEWILITDADGTYPIDRIESLISDIDGADMVVGSRTGGHVSIPLSRKPAKAILKSVVFMLTGFDVPDINSGFRLFRKSLAMRFWRLFPDGFSFTTTITLAALSNDYEVKYVPIDYYKRKGKSTIHPIKDFVGFIVLISRIAVYFAPNKFFIPVSFFILILGVMKGVRDFLLTDGIGDLSVILALVAFQIFFFGVLADLVNKRMN